MIDGYLIRDCSFAYYAVEKRQSLYNVDYWWVVFLLVDCGDGGDDRRCFFCFDTRSSDADDGVVVVVDWNAAYCD